MKRYLTILAFITVIATPAWSLWVTEKSNWDSLPDMAKYGYVMGAFDHFMNLNDFDPPELKNLKMDVFLCTDKLTRGVLVSIIDLTYASDVNLWSKPADEVLILGLKQFCK